MAQQAKKFKELKFKITSEVINVSADSLWTIAREFQDVGIWSTSVDHSTGNGDAEFEGATCSERTCHVDIKGYDQIHEKLTLFDDTSRELEYKITGGTPDFVLFTSNRWRVVEVGPQKSLVEMDITIHLKRFIGALLGGQMKKQISKNVRQVCTDLKIYAETGKVSSAKKARMQTLAQSQNL